MSSLCSYPRLRMRSLALLVALVVSALCLSSSSLCAASEEEGLCGIDLPTDNDEGMCTAPPTTAAATNKQSTLQRVLARGKLVCAHADDTLGHSLIIADDGRNETASGMEPELCKAMAAALEVKASFWRMRQPSERFPLLQSREVDVSFALTSKTVGRDMLEQGQFSIPYFQDQHNIMYRSDVGITGASSLGGKTICVTKGTTNPNVLGDYLASIKHELSEKVQVLEFASDTDALESLYSNECQGFVNDDSVVAGYISSMIPPVGVSYVLASWHGTPFARAPFSALTLDGDSEFASIVDWLINGLFLAEMYDITQSNVDQLSQDSIPGEAQRLLGLQKVQGQFLPFDMKAAIKAVGNYAELYERNFGFLPRSRANMLYQNGGAVFPGGFR